ncbi:MAG TPA: hemerythrin domain-containing protein [Gemmatimonadaceae bacterium]
MLFMSRVWNARCISLGLMLTFVGACSPEPEEAAPVTGAPIEIPGSMRVEHAEIHRSLVAATQAVGAVGQAARELEERLAPHFMREEQIALPPLGLLEALARGESSPEMRSVLPMTDSLSSEWAQMVREHEAIGAAAVRLEQVARETGNADVERLAQGIQLHAKTEEEIFYPAAILVGEIVRARGQQRR